MSELDERLWVAWPVLAVVYFYAATGNGYLLILLAALVATSVVTYWVVPTARRKYRTFREDEAIQNLNAVAIGIVALGGVVDYSMTNRATAAALAFHATGTVFLLLFVLLSLASPESSPAVTAFGVLLVVAPLLYAGARYAGVSVERIASPPGL